MFTSSTRTGRRRILAIGITSLVAFVLQATNVNQVIADELEEQKQRAEAERQDRELRLRIDKRLSLGKQHEAVCQKLALAAKQALEQLAAKKDASIPLEDISALNDQLKRVQFWTTAKWTGLRARNSDQKLEARHKSFHDE